MRPTQGLFSLMVVLWLASYGQACLVVAIEGSDSILFDTRGPSPTTTIEVRNDGCFTDDLAGWSLGLQIVPDAGATGSLQFATAETPATNYVFGANGQGINPIVPSTSVMPSFDNHTGNGVAVPANANLLTLTFNSMDALGTFRIMAVGNEFTGTNVTPFDTGNFPTQPAGNVAFGSSVQLGSVTAVPEPSALLFGLVVVLCLVGKSSSLHSRLTKFLFTRSPEK